MNTPIERGEHDEFSRRIEAENNRQNRRLDILEDSVREIGSLASSVERLATSVESMVKEQERQGRRLEVLENRDGEMWRKAVTYAVTAVIGIVIGLIATHLGV